IAKSSFFTEQTENVTIQFGDTSVSCILSFGGMRIPELRVKDFSQVSNNFIKQLSGEIRELRCSGVLDGQIYTLHNLNVKEGVIRAEFITLGKFDFAFDSVEVHLTGLSVWIEGIRGFVLNGERLERDISVERFKESFSFESGKYYLSNDYQLELLKDDPVDCHVQISHTLVIHKTNGAFSLSECRDVIHEIRVLFSLLVGASLSVEEANIFNADRTKFKKLYFPSVIYAETPIKHSVDALLNFWTLTEDKRWGEILKNFFNHSTFRTIWNRIVPAFNPLGIWEFDILARVVILEMYADNQTKKAKLKLDGELYGKLIETLKETLNQFSASHKLEGDSKTVFTGMEKAILATKNTSLPTLKEKYEALISKIDTSLKDAISFSDKDFAQIQKLRNSTAHGNVYKRLGQGADITQEMQLSDRLLLLLMCLIYLELGFTESDIANSLLRSHCRFKGNARINSRELDRLAGTAEFIELATPVRSLSLNSWDEILLNHDLKKNIWVLNEEITKSIRSGWRSSGIASLSDYVQSLVTLYEGERIETLDKAYVTSDGHETEHFGVMVIRS
ncbi:HEPN domain-containing protein, partial [Serratia plymuthica]|uniref:ApeA N-terminal domain 1-containing protein n=1 Tax=Serratia plymuthica TaxID=82996 RepID=UPI0009364543